MAIFSRKIPYDRKRLLKAAEAAAKKRHFRRAVRLYRQILAAERRNPEIHMRIAPMLARIGRRFDAWESFQIAAAAPEIADDPQRSAALFAKAAVALPKNVEVWRALSRARLRCQEPDAAIAALRKGRRNFRRKRVVYEAIVLLRDALDLSPMRADLVLDLSRQLLRSGQASEALFLLEALDEKAHGETQVAVRRLIWRIDPTFGNTWRWLRAGGEDRRGVAPTSGRRRRA
jgi:tetratricopeptide (TPR) repeat protein